MKSRSGCAVCRGFLPSTTELHTLWRLSRMHDDPFRLLLPCEHRRCCLSHMELLCCSSTNQKKAPPVTFSVRGSQEFDPSEQNPSRNVPNWFRVRSDALPPPQPLQSWSCVLRDPTNVWHATNRRGGTIRPFRRADGTGTVCLKLLQARITT